MPVVPRLQPSAFEKDDDSNHHIDFISATAVYTSVGLFSVIIIAILVIFQLRSVLFFPPLLYFSFVFLRTSLLVAEVIIDFSLPILHTSISPSLFVALPQNLRARMYGIDTVDRLHAKRVAGKIVPAIATSTSAVSGLVRRGEGKGRIWRQEG